MMKSNVMENEVRNEAMERLFVEKEMEQEVKWLLSLHADEGQRRLWRVFFIMFSVVERCMIRVAVCLLSGR